LVATLSVLLVLFVAADAVAQTGPAVSRWDVAAGTGVFNGHASNPAATESYDDWYHTATLGVTVGRYLTSHVKVEGELTLSGEGSRYGQRLIDVPGVGLRPVSLEQLTRTNSMSAALAWQFHENQWVHPFVMAGVSVDFDRTGVHTWPQSYFVGDPRIPGTGVLVAHDRVEHLGTTSTARGLIGGGAKLYVSPQAFFRADTRIGIGRDSSGHVAFRLGFGVDF
jgi:hypothetical protein